MEKIRLASARIGDIFFKICSLLREVPDETLLDMGFPLETLPFLRLKTLHMESVIARLDLIRQATAINALKLMQIPPLLLKSYISNGRCARNSVWKTQTKECLPLGETVRSSIDNPLSFYNRKILISFLLPMKTMWKIETRFSISRSYVGCQQDLFRSINFILKKWDV